MAEAPTSLAGRLLCASPKLADPNFQRAVVLMIEHDEDGALGLVVSKPMDNPMREVLEALGLIWRGPHAQRIRSGGPVEPMRGWFLHGESDWDPAAEPLIPGLHVTASLDAVLDEGHAEIGGDGPVLFLLGYAGWDAQQLSGEISAGAWIPVDLADLPVADPARWLLSTDPEQMWSEALAAIGVDPARVVASAELAS